MTVLSPPRVSGWIETWIGWQPVAEPPAPAADPEARAVAETVSRERLYEHLRRFSTGTSRVTGYEGAHRAADYIEEQYRLLGLERVSTEQFTVPVVVENRGAQPASVRVTMHAEGARVRTRGQRSPRGLEIQVDVGARSSEVVEWQLSAVHAGQPYVLVFWAEDPARPGDDGASVEPPARWSILDVTGEIRAAGS